MTPERKTLLKFMTFMLVVDVGMTAAAVFSDGRARVSAVVSAASGWVLLSMAIIGYFRLVRHERVDRTGEGALPE
ncbi:hypothetical protein [Nocardioides bruguierae]|uniref:Uncharacterized protein n=1 Tax=Nocardioides bruguierae TaxID=2945102 RepID=A0A9X2IHB0_9ACTN|nr:hypothetical protein [Nocardioides bruguierae]MCM0622853.1 hypothetical protein [Nocardioides bruguierae]